MGTGKSYHQDKLKYKSRYVCNMKEEKGGSKERKVDCLWIASLCKQKEKD